MNIKDSNEKSFRVHVFGSSIERVKPDVALVNLEITRVGKHPRDAFQHVHEVSQNVLSFLNEVGIDDIGSSQISLSKSFRNKYTAFVSLHLLLRNLDQLENILTDVVDIGARQVNFVQFQTSKLKEIRANARRQAVKAAREKAELYCNAAGAKLGPVIYIKDVNPDKLLDLKWGQRFNRGMKLGIEHGASELAAPRQTLVDDDGALHAFDPASIVVGAAVEIDFEIVKESV
jgi:uncharacterized protein YggE